MNTINQTHAIYLLLAGGDKRTQERDIEKAKYLSNAYRREGLQ